MRSTHPLRPAEVPLYRLRCAPALHSTSQVQTRLGPMAATAPPPHRTSPTFRICSSRGCRSQGALGSAQPCVQRCPRPLCHQACRASGSCHQGGCWVGHIQGATYSYSWGDQRKRAHTSPRPCPPPWSPRTCRDPTPRLAPLPPALASAVAAAGAAVHSGTSTPRRTGSDEGGPHSTLQAFASNSGGAKGEPAPGDTGLQPARRGGWGWGGLGFVHGDTDMGMGGGGVGAGGEEEG